MALSGGQRDARAALPADAVRSWFRAAPGSLLLEQEHALLKARLPDLFGYYVVQLGYLGDVPEVLFASRIRQKLVVDPQGGLSGEVMPLVADSARLPLRSDSIDVALLVHTLDFARDPHQVLREVERVLIPEGRVVLIGFNVLSLWGLTRLFSRRDDALPWAGRFIATYRIQDWLRLLGLRVEAVEHLMFRPPVRHPGMMRRLAFLERAGERFWPAFSGAYLVRAVKRVASPRLVGPVWRSRRGLLPGGAVKPTARVSTLD